MEVIGKIKIIQEVIIKGEFKSQNVVLKTDEQYPQYISVQFIQDKCNLLSQFKIGQEVKIGINLRGREWINPQGESVFFNTIQGWKIDSFITSIKSPKQVDTKIYPIISDVKPDNSIADDDDLPF